MEHKALQAYFEACFWNWKHSFAWEGMDMGAKLRIVVCVAIAWAARVAIARRLQRFSDRPQRDAEFVMARRGARLGMRGLEQRRHELAEQTSILVRKEAFRRKNSTATGGTRRMGGTRRRTSGPDCVCSRNNRRAGEAPHSHRGSGGIFRRDTARRAMAK